MKKIINEYANYMVPFYAPANFVVKKASGSLVSVSYTHLRAHETKANLVCRLLLEKKKQKK